MGFGDQLRKISSLITSEKTAKFQTACQKLPMEWIEANLPLIKEAMLVAAERGD
jgi:hypothetical protein